MMQLDDVVDATHTDPQRFEEARHRTVRWLDRCIEAHKNTSKQNLFPIVQGSKMPSVIYKLKYARKVLNYFPGGLDEELRKECARELIERDTPGFAIGGLSGGEEKDKFWRQVSASTEVLPKDKPRYLMGVGFALDLVVCSALGVDMYDCVYPTRTARFGNALMMTHPGSLNIRSNLYRKDFRPIDENCPCSTCTGPTAVTRAHIHKLLYDKETSGCHLLTVHNVFFQLRLMGSIRQAIKENKYPEFVKQYLKDNFPEGSGNNVPLWAQNALESVGISL